MLRSIVEDLEKLRLAVSANVDAGRAAILEEALARCIRDLRAIVAQQSRDSGRARPPLRIV